MVLREEVERSLGIADTCTEGFLCEALFAACKSGDLGQVKKCIEDGADIRYQEEKQGESALMTAAAAGHEEIVRVLLENGAPWNAQDKSEKCAGDYAQSNEHVQVVELLLEWACHAEAVLRSRDAAKALEAENLDYLQQKLTYDDDKLLDANGEAVMMGWEMPLMQAHANLICQQGGDILNVGFGLGLVDEAIQGYSPTSHTIIEAHPDVYAHMLKLGWHEKPNVRVLFGRWEDVLPQLGQFDGIFFDTYAEHYDHMRAFHAALPRLLKPSGIYSFFNGLAPRCRFFQLVYCRIVKEELTELGFETQYMELPVPVDNASWDSTWEGVKNRYWFHQSYQLPIVYWKDDEEAGGPEASQEG